MNVSNPTTTRPTETTLPMDTYDRMLLGADELIERAEKAEEKLEVKEQRIKTLEAANTVLKNENIELNREKIRNETLIQLADENLQSSKRVLQCVCAVAGAILGGGLVLAFPPAGVAIAGGAAVAGGAAGGYIVAPVIHEKTNNALIQQVQNFNTKQEVSKKV
ncbi:MAG: hypothetical protein ACRCU0_03590 [Candidatus Rhabdochlamydia sp.]